MSRRLPRNSAISKAESQTLDDGLSPLANVNPILPQHRQFPEMSVLGEVSFQLGYLVAGLLLMVFQYINLYNMPWWVPYSGETSSVDFKHIDMDLVVLVVLILSYGVLVATTTKVFSPSSGPLSSLLSYTVMVVYWMAVVGTLALLIKEYPPQCWSLLLAPVVVYIILFNSDLAFWRSDYHKTKTYRKIVQHACSMNADHIRDEVAAMKCNFNYQLKSLYFDSLKMIYYATLIPYAFTKSTSHLDKSWILVFVVLSFITMVLISFVHRIPAQYMDSLQKSSVHLGHWRKHEERLINIPHSTWSELTIWSKGVNVKHIKGLYKAEGINNAAEPGNCMHSKFYVMFNQPEYVCLLIAAVSLLVNVAGMTVISHYKHWYQLLSMTGIMLFNCYPLFVSTRDYMILARLSEAQSRSQS